MGIGTKLNMPFTTQDGMKAVDVALIREDPVMFQILALASEQLTVSFKET